MRRGFTLIELLVVITILAVLAGAALPYVQAYVAESRIAKAKADLEEIARALAVYETREGEYPDTPPLGDGKSDVSQLTGRYLNKAPIDPWGNSYVVDLNGGIVYSKGPDRVDAAASEMLDNINVPYQPPLALVSCKWVDLNQSGAVDIQNTPDQVQLTFSRKLFNPVIDFDTAVEVNALFNVKVNGASTNFSLCFAPASVQMVPGVNGKTLVYNVSGPGVFTPGRDTVNVVSGNSIKDLTNTNICISDQDVVILPQ